MVESTPEPITELFYSVKNLLSSQHQLSTIPHDLSVSDAVEYMKKLGLPQIPVKSWTTVIGVFSYRSFCQAILDMDEELASNELIGDMEVGEFIEQLRFFNEDDNWETILNRLGNENCVLIGTREDFKGSISAWNVVGFLYQLAKPFVVIAEIELSIRRMITICVNDDDFQECIQNSLSQLYPPEILPTDVNGLTFNDYVQIIGDGRNWEHFKAFFGNAPGMRKRTRNYLKRIGDIRNDICHFRRTLEEEELRFLNNKRDLLQSKARIFEGELRSVEAEVQYVAQPTAE